jgi:hypothetical protein
MVTGYSCISGNGGMTLRIGWYGLDIWLSIYPHIPITLDVYPFNGHKVRMVGPW